MLNTVDDLPRADLQNIDTRATSAKDVFLVFADLKNQKQTDEVKGMVTRSHCQSQFSYKTYVISNVCFWSLSHVRD